MATCCFIGRVPAEIRNQIYECILDDTHLHAPFGSALMCGRAMKRGGLNDYIGLCGVNKQIRAEFSPLLFLKCEIYVDLADAASLFTTILAPWSSQPLLRPDTSVASRQGAQRPPMAKVLINMRGNKHRRPVTHDFLPVFHARIEYSNVDFSFVQFLGTVPQLCQYLNLDVLWRMPTTFVHAIKHGRFSNITFEETHCCRLAPPSYRWTMMIPKPSGTLSGCEKLELATFCRWLAVRNVSPPTNSRWALWDYPWRYPTGKDLVEVAIMVEDKDGVPTEEHVWCIEMDCLILRYNKEDLQKKGRRYLAR
jgi:hypothetical protein